MLIVRHHNLPQNSQLPAAANGTNGAMSNYSNRGGAHSQCVANIENNPCERDWQLDDSSQSSFKPCRQGSGSMTPLPYHDSAHTMYEQGGQLRGSNRSSIDGSGPDLSQIPNSTQAMPLITGTSIELCVTQRMNQQQQKIMFSPTAKHSASSVGGPTTSSNYCKSSNDFGLFKVHAGAHQQHTSSNHHYPSSSVFLENSDILDDKDYPKLYHRHSTIMMTPDSIGCDNNDKKLRRYSDTKLLHATNNIGDDDDEAGMYIDATNSYATSPMPIFNVATMLGASIPNTLNESHTDTYPVPQITDIIFENNSTGGTYDPLELNIQEMLELDMATTRSALRKPRYSMNNVADSDERYIQADVGHSSNTNSNTMYVNNPSDNRNIFKSMPNLSASSENLLQK